MLIVRLPISPKRTHKVKRFTTHSQDYDALRFQYGIQSHIQQQLIALDEVRMKCSGRSWAANLIPLVQGAGFDVICVDGKLTSCMPLLSP